MASGNHPPAYYTASISFSHQSTYYVSGDKRPRSLFEADNGSRPTVPPVKRQRRVEGPNDHGRGNFPAGDGGNLQRAFSGDNSSRVVELDDADLMEDVDQQVAAPIHQQPSYRHPPVTGRNTSGPYVHSQGQYVSNLPHTARTTNQQVVSGPNRPTLPYQYDFDAVPEIKTRSNFHAGYRPHASANMTYGTGDGHIQPPGTHHSHTTHADIGSTLDESQQQELSSNTAFVASSYAYTDSNTYDPKASVEAGLNSRSTVGTSSVYNSQWSTQEDYYNRQRAAQDADVAQNSYGVTGNDHEPLQGLTDRNQSYQHGMSPVYDDADADADIDHEYFNSLQSSSVQHSSHNGPAGFHNGSFAYDNESQFIHRPNFGQHGCRDQPIELDDFEDDLDDSPEITDDLSGLGSHQPVRVYSNVDTTRRGAVSETSNVGISAPSTSGPSFQQSLQHDGASRGTMYPQQVQFNAATRRSDAELAKHNADKKQNKAQEISFKIQGQWWHRLSVRVAAVPAIQHSEIANQLRATANSRGTYQHAPEKGINENDRLAFVPTHMNWAGTRAHRSNELFSFYKTDNSPAACEPQRWIYNGQRVIDHKRKWMWSYDDLPVTIPSAIEGWRMEAYMRRNPSLILADIQGRMPKVFKINVKGGGIEQHGPWKDTALRNRMMRFRWQACLISWTRNEKCDVTKKYFEGFLGQADKDNNVVPPGFKGRNLTRTLGRDLTTKEVKELTRRRAAANPKKSAAASTETSGQEEDEGTQYEADENAPPVHESGIRPMSLLTAAMPVPPTAATSIDYVEDYGDPNVGNHDEDYSQQRDADGYEHDVGSSTLQTWPQDNATTISRQEESIPGNPKLSSGSRQFLNKLQGLKSSMVITYYDGQVQAPLGSIAQQSQPIGQLSRQQSDPTDTKASSGTNTPSHKRPFDNLYDVSPETSPKKKTRTANFTCSEPSSGKAYQDEPTSNTRIGPERLILKPSAPCGARQPIQQTKRDSPRQASTGYHGSLNYQTVPVNGQKRGLGSEAGAEDASLGKAPPQKRHAPGQMLPPLISASGVVVGKSATQRQPERRSFSTKVKSPLRKKALQQSFRTTNEAPQTKPVASSKTSKGAENSEPTLLPSPVITEQRKAGGQSRTVAPVISDCQASTASDNNQLDKTPSGDKDGESANAAVRSPKGPDETGLVDRPPAGEGTGPGTATAVPGQITTPAVPECYTIQLHLQNGVSLRPAAEMDYTHLKDAVLLIASPRPNEPAGHRIASQLDFPPFDITVTDAGIREYNRISALIVQRDAAKVPHSDCEACSEPTEGWMVQCSKTSHGEDEGWYHFHCAGLTEEDCGELEEWVCPACKRLEKIIPMPGRPSIGGKGIAPTSAAAPLRQLSPRVSTNNRVTKNKAPASPPKEKKGKSRKHALVRELADLTDYWSKEEDFAWGAERGPKKRRAAAIASSSRTDEVDSRSVRRSTRLR